MTTHVPRLAVGLALGVALLLAAPPAPAEEGETPALAVITFDRYYDVEALEAALRTIRAAYPDHTRLASMGRSREGRDLWVLTVFDPAAGDPDEKPAFYVDGNTHGNEVQGAEVCLFLAKYLLTRDDPWVRDLLARVTFHIAPCVNPDSRHRFFHTPQTPHSPRRVLRPVDDDRDGVADEDGPDDLDGDGHILRMRVKDPEGDFVVDERDARLMRRRRPGETGQYRMLGLEGTDEDGDGLVNEDGEGGVDPNRQWPTHWRSEHEQRGAGPYPLSEPETRATALWILAHPHIAGVQSFHNAGEMILRPPAAFTDRDASLPAEDRALYDVLGRRGLHVLPTYRYWQIREDLYRVYGGFVEWTYVDLGIFSFTNELWGRMGVHGPDEEEDPRLRALRFNDVALHGAGFVDWHPVPHPRYGEVEVGGWKRFTTRNNPPDFLHETCVRNTLFVLEHAAAMPRIRVAEAEAIDGGWRVRIANDGLLPTIHAMARQHGALPPDRVALDGVAARAALLERPDGTAEALEIHDGEALLPGGLPGERSVWLRLYADGRPAVVRVTSRLGGVVEGRLP